MRSLLRPLSLASVLMTYLKCTDFSSLDIILVIKEEPLCFCLVKRELETAALADKERSNPEEVRMTKDTLITLLTEHEGYMFYRNPKWWRKTSPACQCQVCISPVP